MGPWAHMGLYGLGPIWVHGPRHMGPRADTATMTEELSQAIQAPSQGAQGQHSRKGIPLVPPVLGSRHP